MDSRLDVAAPPVDTAPMSRSEKAKWIGLLMAAGLLVVTFFFGDLLGTPVVRTGAVVTGAYDIISMSHGGNGSRSPDQCRIKLLTKFGTISDAFLGLCGSVAWKVGQPICIDVRIGRISGSVLILHDAPDLLSGGAAGWRAPGTTGDGQIPACDPQGQ